MTSPSLINLTVRLKYDFKARRKTGSFSLFTEAGDAMRATVTLRATGIAGRRDPNGLERNPK